MIRKSEDQTVVHAGEILLKVSDWLDFINSRLVASEEDLLQMEVLLDQLALLRHALGSIDSISVEGDDVTPPRADQQTLRAGIGARFPMLGFYNIPRMVTTDLGQTDTVLGDAIDDLLDITNELMDVGWYLEQGRGTAACWQYAFGYDNHWRYHLRGLLWYLEMRRFEAP